jgi:phenylalanyl-tRNA synthetase alpha chain
MGRMQQRLKEILERALREIRECRELAQLEKSRVKYLGRKGELTVFLRGMGDLSPEERPAMGRLVNEAKEEVEALLALQRERVLQLEKERRLKEEEVDITVPGKKFTRGKRHPLTKTLDEIKNIFMGLGFTVVEGPEVEYAYYNFTALNIPENHPARDVQDTFYINEEIVLRTHTSPNQVRVMEKTKPPIKIIVPGRVYRSDDVDATHSPVFHQIEGLVVDEGITLGDLKGTFDLFVKKLYGEHMETKFRPSHFPFTEPSAEIDATCFVCSGDGCRVCKDTGWIELSGAGMVHPEVLERCGIDTTKYSGFAFGMGLDRLTMLKYGIDDMRLLFENDIRFLRQF